MRSRPDELEESLLAASLVEDWGLVAPTLEFAPVGFGSYHWIVDDAGGRSAFVTVDDLDHKGWLGETRDAACEALRRAFDTAAALRGGGLEFVVAPVRSSRGETVRRLGSRHTLALFPFVAGRAGAFGAEGEPDDRAPVVEILVELHGATAAVERTATRRGVGLPGRDRLEAGLRELDRTWTGGPLSEAARATIAGHATSLARLVEAFDRLAAEVSARGAEWVVTHGEPHPGNVLRTPDGPLLVDWDTVALAPPERDLWMVGAPGSAEVALYAERSGREVDPAALELFRLGWDLADVTEYVALFRSSHGETEDTTSAYHQLGTLLEEIRAG